MPLPKVKDPAIVELERIVTTQLAIPCGFINADLNEANLGLDSLDPDVGFPVYVHLKTGKNKQSFNEANEIQREFKAYGLMLNRSDESTTKSLTTAELNPLVNQMRQLVENMMFWINKSPLSVDGGVDDWTADEVYEKFDAHLYGHAVEFSWTVSTGTSGYYNNPS